MRVTCKKCGDSNEASTGAADEACPSCGAIYAKVDSAMKGQRAAVRRSKLLELAKEDAPRKWVTPVAAKFAYALVLLFMALASAISIAAGSSSMLIIGTTVVFAVVGWIMVEAVLVLFVIAQEAAQIRRHLAVLRVRAELSDEDATAPSVSTPPYR